MSDENKPLKPSEFLKDHVAKGGFENDDVVMEAAGKAFFPERCDPPAPPAVEKIPFGYVKDEDAFLYEEKMRRRDAEQVKQRMREILPPEDASLANRDYSAFNFEFDRVSEQMRQEREAAEAREKAARDKIEATKSVYRKLMNDPDPAKAMAAQVAYFRRFVEGGDK